MTYPSVPSRARSVFFTVAAIAFSSLFVSSARAQYLPTTWTITIDGTGPRLKPGYRPVTFSPTTGGCPYATLAADTERLQVCLGDTVIWQANTSTPKNVMSVITEDPVLDQNNIPTQAFNASDSVPVKGTVDASASLGSHEYLVVIFNKSTKRSYIDDPKIIIGTGSSIDVMKKLLDSIELQAIHLRALVDDSRLGEEAKKQAKQIVDAVAALKQNPGLQ